MYGMYSGMSPMMGMNSMMSGMYGNVGNSGNQNVHENFKNKYSVGYEDYGNQPYAKPYPMGITLRAPQTPTQNYFIDWLKRTFL